MSNNVPVRVKITIDFRRSPKGFYPSERRLMREISWIISEGFTEAIVDYSQALSVIFAWVAPLSFPDVHIARSLCHFLFKLHRYTLLCPCLNSCGAAWTGQGKVVLKDRPVMWLMATLYLQPCKGSRRVNLSSPLCQQ